MAEAVSRPRAVSAVVPCFNVGGYLVEAVRSLLEQTIPPAEILVVDDCSTDPETVEALEEVASLPTCRVIHHAANGGVAVARNTGIDAATGDAVVFLDGDDMFQRSALEAFADSLERHPNAGFAYPTVTCFGNRSDTFTAPPFDHYLLHHVNICPIAAMVRASALELGVRFDPAIAVGHEDWDFWLRLTATGVAGTPSPDAVMFYRRMGFTRMDAGNRTDEDFAASVRRLRPELFDPGRLARIKAQWAPALTIVSRQSTSGRSHLSTSDVQFAHAPLHSPPPGKIVLVAHGNVDGFLRGRFSVERIIAFHETRSEVDFVVYVRKEAVSTRSGFLDELNAEDVHYGFVDPADVVAISYDPLVATRDTSVGPRSEVWRRLLATVARGALEHPPTVAWCAGPAALRSTDVSMPDLASETQSPHAEDPDEWLPRARAGLRAALPWRLVAPPDPLFRETGVASAVQTLIQATDDVGTTSLYAVDEHALPPGVRVGDVSCVVLAHESALTSPLLRVVEAATGRRSLVVGAPAPGWTVERVLGYAETAPIPGTLPLQEVFAGTPAVAPVWVYPHSRGLDLSRAHRRPLLGARRWWRGRDPRSGLHYYDLSPERLTRSCTLEGPVCSLPAVAGANGQRNVHALRRPGEMSISGFTSRPDAAPRGHRVHEVVGLLDHESRPPLRPVFVQAHRGTGDLLCSNLKNEGRGAGYREAELVGFGWC